MNQTSLIENMQKMLDELDVLIKYIEQNPAIEVQGRLICCSGGKTTRFYQISHYRAHHVRDRRVPLISRLVPHARCQLCS